MNLISLHVNLVSWEGYHEEGSGRDYSPMDETTPGIEGRRLGLF
jgi:hypothetical protein